MTNILVISTIDDPASVLEGHIGPDDTVRLIVPVVRQGMLDWLANDDKAFTEAERLAESAAAELPAEDVSAAAGEGDIALAVQDALATFPADEIIVAIDERDDERDLIDGLATRAGEPGRSVAGVPLRVVVLHR